MSDSPRSRGDSAGSSVEARSVRGLPSAVTLDGIAGGWNRTLTAFDYVEYCTEVHSRERTSMVYIEILDRVPEWARLRNDVERASRVVLRMRQSVVVPTLPVAPARWVTDPDFELDYHLRRVSLPGPGTLAQLLDLVRALEATPMDLNRPLWEATLVEGLHIEDGAAALVWKLSQPVADGMAGILLDQLMHSDVADPDRGPMPPIPIPEDLTAADLTRAELRRLPMTVGRGLSRVGDAIRSVAGSRDPVGAVRGIGRAVRTLQNASGAVITEPSPLFRRRGLNRRFATLDIDLAALRGAARAHHCSVQDAFVAAVAGGLRIYHDRLGVPVNSVPIAMPIGVATGDEPIGDLWSGLSMAAPVGEPDPAERMRRVRQLLRTTRADPALSVLRSAAPILPWVPVQMFGALGASGRGIDVHISTVAGQPGTVFLAGARVTRVIPLGPLLGGAATIVSCSMSGRHYVGVSMDPVAVAEPEVFMQCLTEGFAEVTALADAAGDGDKAANQAPDAKKAADAAGSPA